MKAFVTGGTGFIGGHLVRRLVQRGDQVVALVRSPHSAAALEAAGVTTVLGDVRERESMRAGMTGCDMVFHAAAWFKTGAKDWQTAEEINVTGTRNVLSLAHELGVPRIVYTSTIAVFGDTHGALSSETSPAPGEPFLTEYDRTKWRAHFEVALPLIQQGAPVIIVMPGAVIGPGDNSQMGVMMEWFYRGRFPLFPAPEMSVCFAHVDDIVEGHILAAECGKVGESYILTGPCMKMRQAVELWAEVTGRPAPLLHLPPGLVKPFGPLMSLAGRYLAIPDMFSEEGARVADASYLARSDKARAELGWQARPLVDALQATFDSMAQTIPAPPAEIIRRRYQAGTILSLGLALAVLWLLGRRRR
jgi:dihydroflavonol-4-reductase